MRVSFLVVNYRGKARITLHDDDDQAWSGLVDFVDAAWVVRAPQTEGPPHFSDEERVRIFFLRDPDASYLVGSADLSDAEERAASLIDSEQPSLRCHRKAK